MKTSDGFDQCYNGQVAVDAASQIIVATRLTNGAADQIQLVPMVDRVATTLGAAPGVVVADAGYKNEASFATLEARAVTAYVSLGREGKTPAVPNPKAPATTRMAARLATPEGQAQYRRRKAIVEPVLGWIKEILGFRRFSLRGEAKARGEWNLVCLAVNVKRFHRLGLR